MTDQTGTTYGGFWIRFLAFLVDSAILSCALVLFSLVCAFLGPIGAGLIVGACLIGPLLYWGLMQASVRQATIGKSLLGMKVTDRSGRRISLLRSLGRELAKYVSAFPLMIGFVLAAFTGRKQALHDLVASTTVVQGGPRHLIAALVVGVFGWLAPVVIVMFLGAGLLAGVMGVLGGKMMQQVTTEMTNQQAAQRAPAQKPTMTPPVQKAPPTALAVDVAAKPGGAAPDFDALLGPALTGLEKPGTTRAGPAILELSTFFPTSVWVKVHLPANKDFDVAPAPEITITNVLDTSGQNYYDAASSFESGMFLAVRLGNDSTPARHLSGLRTVQIKPGLSEKALQKIEGQLRIRFPVEARAVVFEAGDTGKEKPMYGAVVVLRSLAGAEAVLNSTGASRNVLGVRGYGKDGVAVAVESRQFSPGPQAGVMAIHVKFKAPVSKVEAIVAASMVERQFPFSLAKDAVAGPPSSTTAAALPSAAAPIAQAAASAGPKPASATPPIAATAAPTQAKPAPSGSTAAPPKSVDAAPPPAKVAKNVESEPRARAPRRRVSPPTAPPAPASAVASAPAVEPTVITPKYNDLMTAVLYGDVEAAKQLLDLGWWVDKRPSNGLTPLMGAVMNRDSRMVQLLLTNGADPNAGGPGGVTPLRLARDRNDTGTAMLLEQGGAR